MRLVVALSVAIVLAVFLLYTSFAGGATPSIRPSQLNDNVDQRVSLAGVVVGPVEGDARGDAGEGVEVEMSAAARARRGAALRGTAGGAPRGG